MKKFFIVLLGGILVLGSCKEKSGEGNVAADYDKKEVAYALGVAMGTSLKETNLNLDYESFRKGFEQAMEGKKPSIDPEEADLIIQMAIYSEMNKKGSKNLIEGNEFLEKNAKKAGIKTTESGLQYEIVSEGTGFTPAKTDVVKVDYEGRLLDGTVFDSSYERGEPAVFPLDRVIPGWTEGLQLMTVGSTYNLYIPSSLAYGEHGAGAMIGPNATLIFKVNLISIEEMPDITN